MPGGCNLHCRHCYVASWPAKNALREEDYYALTVKLIGEGLVDVVIPGMEPLLRRELWTVLDAARDANARTVGITTNATLLASYAPRLNDSSLTVLNVSLDGPQRVHDAIRGQGVFRRVEEGVRAFRRVSDKRLITNTTVHRENLNELISIAYIGREWGVDYSAFHPFEFADEAENDLVASTEDVVNGYLLLIDAFRNGQTGSIVLEAEASTLSVIVGLVNSGALDECRLVKDEAGFYFLHQVIGERELLVSLMFYPHHFVRTIRVADDGGLSSCRSMARTGWEGVGDLRREPLRSLLNTDKVAGALAIIWDEFKDAQKPLGTDSLLRLCDFLASRTAILVADDHESTVTALCLT
jgi:pyruvate-formate lyase-activating enzyme